MPGIAKKLSVQLYTLRDLTKTDFAGTVRELGKVGFKAVELAGFGNLTSAKDVRKACDDAGVVISGVHTGLDGLLADTQKVVDEHVHVLGTKFLAIPYAPLDGKGEAEYAAFATQLDQLGAAVAKAGAVLAYHNHSFEFKPLRKGLDGMDVMLAKSSPAHLKLELDLYWVKHGGYDVATYLRKVGTRAPVYHFKDMEVGPDRRFAPVGEGILDWKNIITTGEEIGTQWYVVEQDNSYDLTPMAAVTLSYNNLKAMGVL